MFRYLRTRVLLSLGLLACFAVAWWAAGAIGFPAHRGFSASVLQQPSPAFAIVGLAVAWAACTAAGSVFAGWVRYDAGLWCACAGMSVMSLRSGTIFDALAGRGGGTYASLAVELALLYAIVLACWFGAWQLRTRSILPADAPLPTDAHDEPTDQKLLAVATQAATMVVLMMILCRSDAKNQVLAAVFASSLLATLCAYAFVPIRPSAWFLGGPLLTGLVGYAWGAVSPGNLLAIGQPSGFFSALQQALPLDYATAGPSGAILGYWLSRNWKLGTIEEADEEAATQPA